MNHDQTFLGFSIVVDGGQLEGISFVGNFNIVGCFLTHALLFKFQDDLVKEGVSWFGLQFNQNVVVFIANELDQMFLAVQHQLGLKNRRYKIS